jgi:hypothetical protein
MSIGGRVGFGISKDPKERNKQYASHCGDIVMFSFLYGGQRSHAKALERTIKTQYVDNIWVIDDWKTEWLINSVTMADLHQYVDELIDERHYNLKLVATEYNFTKDNIFSIMVDNGS